ncbi:MAG: NAD-dependent epimerase/dehydratase family protein [Anaerolineae bacterium]|nr:NAD-dependent epimerase/dehydratase family protein [Anaerolineae bacterium]
MSRDSDLHVVFGTGPVGLALVETLAAQGKQVRAVNRRGSAPVPPEVEMRVGDATDLASTRALCTGATTVYNCTNAPYTRWPEMFPPLQVGVLEGAAVAGAKLVVMENLYMYGPTGGRPIHENLPYTATGRKGHTRAAMAHDLLAAHQAGKVRVAIGRASDFYGPRALDSAVGDIVFGAAIRGKAAQALGNIDLPHTVTYVPDIARGLAILGERDDALGSAWHIPSAPPISLHQFIGRVYAAAGQKLRIQVASRLMVGALGLFVPIMREFSEMMYEWEEPYIVDDSRFVQTFGQIATPLEEGIDATVRWFRDNVS